MNRAVRRPSRRPSRGMTLIEILVVLVIIAILATLTTLSIGLLGGDRELETETRRLTDAIAVLQEQAQLEGRDHGLRVEATHYEFLRFDAFTQRWSPVEDDQVLAPRQLPQELAFELTIEGRPILLREEDRPETRLPQVFAYGSGDITPYRLSIARRQGERVTLIGGPDGSIEVQRHGAD